MPLENREELLNKKMAGLRKVFAKTKFGENVPMIPVSATGGS